MAKLRAPDSFASITIEGVKYEAAPDCSIHLPDHLVSIAKSHGYGDWTDELEILPEPDDVFSTMKRTALFAWLKEHGVRVGTPVDNVRLRAECRAEAKRRAEPEVTEFHKDTPCEPQSTPEALPEAAGADMAPPSFEAPVSAPMPVSEPELFMAPPVGEVIATLTLKPA